MDERVGSSKYSINHFNVDNFNMFQTDFMHETGFENFISDIRVENIDPTEKFCLEYECNHFTNSYTGLELELELPQTTLYGHNETDVGVGIGTGMGGYDVMDPNLNLIWNQEEEDVKVFDPSGDDDSSETATIGNPDTPSGKRSGSAKGDRTRTLISERKRRSGMKEKLYALRSLVPNITKVRVENIRVDFFVGVLLHANVYW